jgi:hypothetical protein
MAPKHPLHFPKCTPYPTDSADVEPKSASPCLVAYGVGGGSGGGSGVAHSIAAQMHVAAVRVLAAALELLAAGAATGPTVESAKGIVVGPATRSDPLYHKKLRGQIPHPHKR